MIRIAVIEDDEGYRALMNDYLGKYEKEHDVSFSISLFDSSDSFLDAFDKNFDIILSDIEMPGTNGMEAAEKIRELDSNVVIMFITNLAHFAIKGYEVGALDYVLKPIQYFNFANKIDRAIRLAENRATKDIFLQNGGSLLKLNSNDIFYVEVQNHNLCYHTAKGDFTLRGSLKGVEETLPKNLFAKSSNWCLVGLNHVSEIHNDTAIVSGHEVQISRRCKKSFIDALIKNVGSN